MRCYIAEQWNILSAALGLERAPQVQRQEMRRAFYAGVAALMDITTRNLSVGGEPQESDYILLNDVASELERFNESVKAGVA